MRSLLFCHVVSKMRSVVVTGKSHFSRTLFLFSAHHRPEMALSFLLKQRISVCSALMLRSFRSDAALEALANASKDNFPNLVLYNYPSFSGAFSALFAYLYHSHMKLPCCILPFSSVAPFRLDDLCIQGLRTCYFLDFLGPRGFALELSKRTSCKIIGFDHLKISLSQLICKEESNENLVFYLNLEKSSSSAAYEYFSSKLSEIESNDGHAMRLFSLKDGQRVETVLEYIEDADLQRWNLPDSKAFNIGICEWRSKLNCTLNPHMYEQLMEMSASNLIARGNHCMSTCQTAASELLTNMFRVRLGRGFYGECLGVKLEGNLDLVDEIGKELSKKSAAAGLRPIGAVIYMQRKNLKMSLRSTDSCTDTSEVAKAYGGGGFPSSSSFMIRMDEYNKWISQSAGQVVPDCFAVYLGYEDAGEGPFTWRAGRW